MVLIFIFGAVFSGFLILAFFFFLRRKPIKHTSETSEVIVKNSEKSGKKRGKKGKNISPPRKVFSLSELSRYKPGESHRVLFSHQKRVFDAGSCEKFRKDGAYSFLAGKDSSLILAKMSRDESLFNTFDKVKLTPEEMKDSNEWNSFFRSEYKEIGVLEIGK